MTGTLIDRLVLTRNDDSPNDLFRFSAADNEIVLANIGDYGGGSSAEEAVAAMVLDWTPDAVLTNGNNDYDETAWGDTITANYGEFMDRNALLPVPGPEDWEANDLDDYLDYFEAVTERRYYYKRTIGPVSVFMMDSYSGTPDGNTPTSFQAQWLAEELSRSTSPWNIVVIHHPPYSTDDQDGSVTDSRWDFTGADIVISGHAHNYQRNKVGDIYYIVNGLGGVAPPVDGFTADASFTQFKYNSYYGAGVIKATPNKLVWEFRAPLHTEIEDNPDDGWFAFDGFYDEFRDYTEFQSSDLDGGFRWKESSAWSHYRTQDETLLLREVLETSTVSGDWSTVTPNVPSRKSVRLDFDSDEFLQLGGNATCRQYLDAYVGAWTELWLIVHWSVDLILGPSAPYPLMGQELLWALGLQNGAAETFNSTGTVPHALGIKAQPYASTNTDIALSSGGVNYIRPYTEGFKIENGSQTSQGIQGAFRVAGSGQSVRNALVMRFLVGSPNWTIAWLRPDTDTTVETDVGRSDVVSVFQAADWDAAKALLTGYSESTYSVAVDTGTYGDFDAVFLSWPHWFTPIRLNGIYGRVFLP